MGFTFRGARARVPYANPYSSLKHCLFERPLSTTSPTAIQPIPIASRSVPAYISLSAPPLNEILKLVIVQLQVSTRFVRYALIQA